MPRANTVSQLQLWKERLEQIGQSGQSVQKYCDSAGCTPASFYYWKRKVSTASQLGVSLPASQGSAFVPVVVRDNRSSRVLVRVKDGNFTDGITSGWGRRERSRTWGLVL